MNRRQEENLIRQSSTPDEIQTNFENLTFFHGCQDKADARTIRINGFSKEFVEQDGGRTVRYFRDGNLGSGTYLTCNWKTALFFGHIIIRATLQRGTFILDASQPPDTDVLAYLKREFGAALLTSKRPLDVLPRNKQLTRNEFVALIRHHYNKTWEEPVQRGLGLRWDAERQRHARALESLAKKLMRYGFHGFGNPSDDNGIVVFQTDRIKVLDIPVEIPWEEMFKESQYFKGNSEPQPGVTLKMLLEKFPAKFEMEV